MNPKAKGSSLGVMRIEIEGLSVWKGVETTSFNAWVSVVLLEIHYLRRMAKRCESAPTPWFWYMDSMDCMGGCGVGKQVIDNPDLQRQYKACKFQSVAVRSGKTDWKHS
jgi:hypothetical protein